MQAGVQELLLFIADPIPCRVEDEEQDHGDSDTQALEPRYSHHCYVRADDRHASAIGPILRIDQLPAGSYEFTGCGYGLGAVSVCQLPLHLGM